MSTGEVKKEEKRGAVISNHGYKRKHLTVTDFGITPVSLTWVGDHQQDAVGAVLHDVGDDELKDVDVALHQVEAALALLLAGTGSHHHHFGVGCHTVVWQKEREREMFPMKQHTR